MGSPEVVAAWEVLSGAVVQEFIYDSWWSSLSPDVDFPAAVRGALNAAFGEVARAARGLDVRRLLLGEGAELLMEHLQLFRDARDAAAASLEGGIREWNYPKWQGHCTACDAWNTVKEVRLGAPGRREGRLAENRACCRGQFAPGSLAPEGRRGEHYF